MPTFDADREEITAFKVSDTYLFKQYFDQDEEFDALKLYYNNDKYRFEVPEDELDDAQQILDKYFFDLRIEDDWHSYCVVMEQGDDYSDVLRNSILKRHHNNNIVILVKDLLSVEQAVEQGARRLSEADVNIEL